MQRGRRPGAGAGRGPWSPGGQGQGRAAPARAGAGAVAVAFGRAELRHDVGRARPTGARPPRRRRPLRRGDRRPKEEAPAPAPPPRRRYGKPAASVDLTEEVPAVGKADLPIPEYDTLRATEIINRLDGLDAAQLEALRAHEAAGKNRTSVLARIDGQLESVQAPGWQVEEDDWDAAPEAEAEAEPEEEVEDEVEEEPEPEPSPSPKRRWSRRSWSRPSSSRRSPGRR